MVADLGSSATGIMRSAAADFQHYFPASTRNRSNGFIKSFHGETF